jgi:hypothetical protein
LRRLLSPASEAAVAALEHDVPRERSDWSASEVRRVVIRLTDGDVVQAGTAANLDGAKTLAHDLIREIEQPAGEWPQIGDRRISPAAVVSVDVLRVSA